MKLCLEMGQGDSSTVSRCQRVGQRDGWLSEGQEEVDRVVPALGGAMWGSHVANTQQQQAPEEAVVGSSLAPSAAQEQLRGIRAEGGGSSKDEAAAPQKLDQSGGLLCAAKGIAGGNLRQGARE